MNCKRRGAEREEEHEEAYDGRTEHQKLREGDMADYVKIERERKDFLRGGNWGRKQWEMEQTAYIPRMPVLCYSCKHNNGIRCSLYGLPILHDTRYCDGYEKEV